MGGAATLFKKPNSQNWHVRFSVAGQGQQRKPTGEKDVKKAERAAKKIYIELTSRNERGLSVNGYAFEQVANEFLQNIDRKVQRGEKKPKDLQNVTGVITRYFIPYFGTNAIDEIDEADIEAYKEWRIDYWISGPGKDVHFIKYRRGRHMLQRPTRHEAPSLSRQHQELSMLRQLFKFAARKRYLETKAVPAIRSEPVKNKEGAGLTAAEFEHLAETASKRLEEAHSQVVWGRRLVLQCFVHIAANTGMRPTELMNLRWGDVYSFELSKNEWPMVDEVSLSVRGKGRFGNAIPMYSGVEILVELFDLWWDTLDRAPTANDPVFFHPNGKPIDSFKGGFASLLEAAGLLFDREGRRRNAYCLRHFYITEQIKKGTSLYMIAINTRTSVSMIEKTYSHVIPSMFAKQLSEDRKRPKK